jgi:hypothetical protein
MMEEEDTRGKSSGPKASLYSFSGKRERERLRYMNSPSRSDSRANVK